jgi:carboxypeptidase Q
MSFLTSMLAAGALVLAATATAQAPSDPVLSRIVRIATDSSHLQPLAHTLLDSLGPRLTGTPDADRASDWLVRQYRSWNIDARKDPTGTWRGWRRGHSHIDLVQPRVRSLEGLMLGYSPGTGGKDVIASTIILPLFPDSNAFVRWLPQARGRLVLVSPPKSTCRPVENWVEFGTEQSRGALARSLDSLNSVWTSRNIRGTGYNLALGGGDLGLRMEKAGIAGLITSRAKDAWGTFEVFETYNTRAPAIAISCEDYGLVYRLTESGAGPRLRLNLDAQLLGERPVFNTIATIRGTEKPDEYVMLSSHFDTWDGASGATDNGTGTLIMMEAMRILKEVYPRPKRTIISGHWTTEEQGAHGSKAFAEDHPEVVKGLQALFNQDNGTGRIRGIYGAGLPDAANHLTAWLSQLPEGFRSSISYSAPGRLAGRGSDDAAFACYGAPAFTFGSLGWSYGSYTWHTNRDTYDKVVFDDLKWNAALAAMMVYLASEDPTLATRELAEGLSLPVCPPAARKTEPRLR